MNKGTKRPPVDRKKAEVVQWVAGEFNCTIVYVYGVLRGTYTNGRAEEIKRAFNKKYAELQQILS